MQEDYQQFYKDFQITTERMTDGFSLLIYIVKSFRKAYYKAKDITGLKSLMMPMLEHVSKLEDRWGLEPFSRVDSVLPLGTNITTDDYYSYFAKADEVLSEFTGVIGWKVVYNTLKYLYLDSGMSDADIYLNNKMIVTVFAIFIAKDT